ncbi:MAG: acireductone synthase, partial [Synechococcaceae bacterium WBB_3_034]|nr:acireductone synthase [Synechococcaceae bacterium WBB_3_034]
MAITHLLLDIEGTTCPVSFVAEVLFPYARQALGPFLQRHGAEPEVAALLREVEAAWRQDPHPEAQALGKTGDLGAYLEWLIDHDIKLTPLKDLQGRIWADGYGSG